MEFIKLIEKYKERRVKRKFIKLVAFYRRTGSIPQCNKWIRNTIVHNHYTRKEFLHLLKYSVKIQSSSKRVMDIIGRL